MLTPWAVEVKSMITFLHFTESGSTLMDTTLLVNGLEETLLLSWFSFTTIRSLKYNWILELRWLYFVEIVIFPITSWLFLQNICSWTRIILFFSQKLSYWFKTHKCESLLLFDAKHTACISMFGQREFIT